jgi:hypothetical protein
LADGSGCAFSLEPDTVAGFDSGSRCVNLAFHTGARRAVLLGFDMRDYPLEEWWEGNFHAAHREPPVPGSRESKFAPAHRIMAAKILEVCPGFAVLNATPGSALECWPKINLEDVL